MHMSVRTSSTSSQALHATHWHVTEAVRVIRPYGKSYGTYAPYVYGSIISEAHHTAIYAPSQWQFSLPGQRFRLDEAA